MRGALWIELFFKALTKFENQANNATSDARWTEFIGTIIEEVGKETNCYVARRRKGSGSVDSSGEYLNIDHVFIDNREYFKWTSRDWDPPALPSAIVEVENEYRHDKITYDLWKILCIRAPVRVLICYQANRKKVQAVRKSLERVIWQRSLMKGTDGDLLVVIGDDSKDEEAEWSEYFGVFEWRNDRLERVEGLHW